MKGELLPIVLTLLCWSYADRILFRSLQTKFCPLKRKRAIPYGISISINA